MCELDYLSPSSTLTYNFIIVRFQSPVALRRRMFCSYTVPFILLQLSSYVTGLEERLESLETLLQQVRLIFYNFLVAHLNAFVRYVQIRISLKSWDLQLSVDRGRLTSSRLFHLRPSLLNLNLRTFELQILLYLIVNVRLILRFRVPKDHEQSPKQSRLRVRVVIISLMTRPQMLLHRLQIQKKCLYPLPMAK
jgi:hypothetical protein